MTHATLNDPDAVARLLAALWSANAEEQAMALAERAAAHATLDNPAAVARLLEALEIANAGNKGRTLINRLPAAGQFAFFRRHVDPKKRFLFGREPDGSPAAPWSWSDLD